MNHITRRDFLRKTTALGAGALISNNILKFRIGTKRTPNIVFFFVDDLGWFDLGYMGSTYHETPNIDQLAADGMVFTDAYANAANCAPTRACMLSGQYAPRHGVYTVWKSDREPAEKRKVIPTPNTETLASENVTFMEALNAAGYVSASMGKWHLGNPGTGKGPTEQGFTVNVGGYSIGYPPGGHFVPYKNPYLSDGPDGEYLTDRLTDEALAFIDTNKENPFFLYLTHYAIHEPIEGKQDLVDYYASKPPSGGQGDPNEVAKPHEYAALVHSVDESLGRIVDKLEELNLTDDTVVILGSDNGAHACYTSNGPLRGLKGMFYEGGIRVPFAFKWPGKVRAGATCDVPIITTDLYPTFLDIAGVPKPDGKILDGESLMPLLRETGPLSREAIFWHFPAYLGNYFCQDITWRAEPCSIIRKGNWKLIETFEPDPQPFTYELYDLENDIGETTNLADTNTQKRDELIADLHAWQQAIDAPICTEPNPLYEP